MNYIVIVQILINLMEFKEFMTELKYFMNTKKPSRQRLSILFEIEFRIHIRASVIYKIPNNEFN